MKSLHNPEYEKALLGCILIENEVLDDNHIQPELFQAPRNRAIFNTILELKNTGVVVDIREVALCIPQDAGYIATLSDIPSSANVKFYIDRLVEFYQKRMITRLARLMIESVESDKEVSEILYILDEEALRIDETKSVVYQNMTGPLHGASMEIEAAFKSKGALTGVPSGFGSLDEKTDGWQRQELIVIGARPGTGKTSIALNMVSAASRQGFPVGIFSAEMSAVSLAKRMYADWANVDFHKLKSGFLSGADMLSIAEATGAIPSAKIFINDKPSISIHELVADARRMKRKERIGLLVVDYLSLIRNEKQGVPRHEQVAEISMKLKGLARELDIPVIVLSQLTREAQNGKPNLAQLRDSGAVEQDADVVILLQHKGYTDDTNKEMRINLIVEKQRNGATGLVPMIFKAPKMRFAETEQEW